MALAALDTVVGKALASGDTDTAMAAAHRILAVEPWHEGAHQRSCAALPSPASPTQRSPSTKRAATSLTRSSGWSLNQPPSSCFGRSGRRSSRPGCAGASCRAGRGARRTRAGARPSGRPAHRPRLSTGHDVGPGGVGKSRLAVELGRLVQARRDDVHSVSLAGIRPAHEEDAAALVVSTIGDALGLASAARGDPFVEQLRHRRLLELTLRAGSVLPGRVPERVARRCRSGRTSGYRLSGMSERPCAATGSGTRRRRGSQMTQAWRVVDSEGTSAGGLNTGCLGREGRVLGVPAAPFRPESLGAPRASGLLLALLLKPCGAQRFERTPAGATTP